MITAKVTSKGQVTIPKKVREKLGVHPGEDVGFEEKNGLIYIQKTVNPQRGETLASVFESINWGT